MNYTVLNHTSASQPAVNTRVLHTAHQPSNPPCCLHGGLPWSGVQITWLRFHSMIWLTVTCLLSHMGTAEHSSLSPSQRQMGLAPMLGVPRPELLYANGNGWSGFFREPGIEGCSAFFPQRFQRSLRLFYRLPQRWILLQANGFSTLWGIMKYVTSFPTISEPWTSSKYKSHLSRWLSFSASGEGQRKEDHTDRTKKINHAYHTIDTFPFPKQARPTEVKWPIYLMLCPLFLKILLIGIG